MMPWENTWLYASVSNTSGEKKKRSRCQKERLSSDTKQYVFQGSVRGAESVLTAPIDVFSEILNVLFWSFNNNWKGSIYRQIIMYNYDIDRTCDAIHIATEMKPSRQDTITAWSVLYS